MEAAPNTPSNAADNNTKEPSDKSLTSPTYEAGFLQVFLLAIGIALPGICASWGIGLKAGFLSLITSVVIMGTGYAMLALCLAELTSIANFAGGMYGYARCSMGPKWGFIVSCFELFENNFFTLANMDLIGHALSSILHKPLSYAPLFSLLVYLLLISIHMKGGWYFWNSVSFAAIITLIITFIYITAVASHSPNLDPSTMPMDEREALAFTHGGMGFMVYLMYSSWFFIGIETITVCGSIISNGRTIIPKVLMASITVIFVLAIVTVCMAYFGEHPKDIDRIIDTDFPLSLGMIDHLDAPEGLAVFLQLIPLFGAAMGFMYTSKRTLNSMAQSGLVNPWFKRTYGSEAVPIRAMGCSAGIQYLLLLIMHYGHVESVLFPLTMLGACGCYLGVFYSYIIFSHRFPNMDRPVKIPYGVYLAYLGIAIFALVGISILGFHDNWYVLVGLLVLFFLLAHRYYYKVVEGRQFFSKEEQKKFMKAYILNANQMRHRGGTTGAGAHSSHSHPTTTRLVTLWNEIAQKLDPSEKMLPQFHPASRGKTEMNTVGNTKQTGRTSPSKRLMSMSKRPSTLIILSNNKVTPDTTPESSPNSSPVMGTHKEHECSPSSPTAMSPRKVIPFMQPTNDAVTSNSEVPKHGRIWAMLEAGMERVWQLPILVGQYLFFTSPSPPPRFPHPITLQLLGRENDLQVPRPDGHVQGREGVMEEAVVVSEPVEIALSPSEVVDDIPLSSPLSMERQHNHPVPSKLKITWSGRALSSRDSRKLFDALTTSRDAMDLVNSLRCVLPEHFQVKEDDELGSTID